MRIALVYHVKDVSLLETDAQFSTRHILVVLGFVVYVSLKSYTIQYLDFQNVNKQPSMYLEMYDTVSSGSIFIMCYTSARRHGQVMPGWHYQEGQCPLHVAQYVTNLIDILAT